MIYKTATCIQSISIIYIGSIKQYFLSYKLLVAFYEVGLPVFHIHIQSLTTSSKDHNIIHKTLTCYYLPGSHNAIFFKETILLAGKLVFLKMGSSIFTSTNIDYVLQNMSIKNLVICGIVIMCCIEITIRDITDLDY